MKRRLRVAGLGDNVVDRYVDQGLEYPGGSACNFAVHARRLSADSAYLGAIGTDESGTRVYESLLAERVDVSHTTRYDAPQAFANVRLDEHGNREFLAWQPTPVDITLASEDFDFLATFDLVHTGHSSLIDRWVEPLSEVTKLSFDFSYKDMDYARVMLPFLSMATFSAAERSVDESISFGREAQRLGPDLIVLTRGSEGAVILNGPTVLVQPARPNVTVIDTLGAGDAFVAGLLTSLLGGASLEAAAMVATDYAAATCEIRGAFGYPSPISQDRTLS